MLWNDVDTLPPSAPRTQYPHYTQYTQYPVVAWLWLRLHPSTAPYIHARQASDVDIAFPGGAGDDHLLEALRRVLPNEFDRHPPDLVLFGETEKLGDRVDAARACGRSVAVSHAVCS